MSLDSILGTAGKALGVASGLQSLFGGSDTGRQWDNQKGAMFFQADLAREFAQMGTRWRVADAQAAGLHPLFALGAQPFNAPSAMVDGGQAPEPRARTTREASMNLMMLAQAGATARKDAAIAGYYDALAAKVRQGQANNNAFPDPGDASGFVDDKKGDFVHQGTQEGVASVNPFFDRRRLVPSQITSMSSLDTSEEAGTNPAWKRYRLNNAGFEMLFPGSSSLSEALESMSESKVVMGWVISKNVEKYGQKWLVEFMRQFGGLFDWNN